MKNRTERIEIDGWNVAALVDDDGHLEVFVDNKDGSQVFALDADIGNDGSVFGERFTTQCIEDKHIETTDWLAPRCPPERESGSAATGVVDKAGWT